MAAARKSPWRLLWGTGIALLGFALGVVAGSVLEGPRLLLEWLRGPVRSVELAANEPAAVETGGLREVSELHRPVRRAAARPAERASEPPALAAARPPEAPVAAPRAAPPPSAPRPAPAATPPAASGVVDGLKREVAARPPEPPAAPEPAAAERAALVQVASTPDSAEAQRIVARLRASGFDAFSLAVRPNGTTTTHRVRVRAAKGQTPEALAERLKDQGFDTWITRD